MRGFLSISAEAALPIAKGGEEGGMLHRPRGGNQYCLVIRTALVPAKPAAVTSYGSAANFLLGISLK
jgi:hypothetical protein